MMKKIRFNCRDPTVFPSTKFKAKSSDFAKRGGRVTRPKHKTYKTLKNQGLERVFPFSQIGF